MTAQEAKQLANFKSKPVFNLLIENKIDKINKLIESAANRGKFSIIYNEYVGKGIISHLEQRGFIVKYYTNLMANENSNSIEISWN